MKIQKKILGPKQTVSGRAVEDEHLSCIRAAKTCGQEEQWFFGAEKEPDFGKIFLIVVFFHHAYFLTVPVLKRKSPVVHNHQIFWWSFGHSSTLPGGWTR